MTTITTTDELDALPKGTIVVGTSGRGYQSDPTWHEGVPGDEFPVRVVHRPDRDLLAEARAEGAHEALLSAAETARVGGGILGDTVADWLTRRAQGPRA
jgi:hypothetical protein